MHPADISVRAWTVRCVDGQGCASNSAALTRSPVLTRLRHSQGCATAPAASQGCAITPASQGCASKPLPHKVALFAIFPAVTWRSPTAGRVVCRGPALVAIFPGGPPPCAIFDRGPLLIAIFQRCGPPLVGSGVGSGVESGPPQKRDQPPTGGLLSGKISTGK